VLVLPPHVRCIWGALNGILVLSCGSLVLIFFQGECSWDSAALECIIRFGVDQPLLLKAVPHLSPVWLDAVERYERLLRDLTALVACIDWAVDKKHLLAQLEVS
jgi:hypothetical protein